MKVLNLYTPVNEFEERVSVSFIRTIQVRAPIFFDSPTQSFEWTFCDLLKDNVLSFILFYNALTFLIIVYWENKVSLKQR